MWKFITISSIFLQLSVYTAVIKPIHEVILNCASNNRTTKEIKHLDCFLMDVKLSKDQVTVTSTDLDMNMLLTQYEFAKINVKGNKNYPEYFPRNLASTVKGVCLFYYTNTPLKFIKREDFTPFGSQLQHLFLTHNEIEEISHDIFYDLTHLFTLDISHNYLKTLPPNLLANAPLFHKLSVNSNEITKLHPELFKNCPSLYFLYAESNEIGEFHEDLLKYNPDITVISMRHNKIKNIPIDFTIYGELVVVDFTHNAGTCDTMHYSTKPYDNLYDEDDLKKWIKNMTEFQKKIEEVCRQ